MRLVEVRLLDGPNVYRLEPAVKVEVHIGRRRTWYGERMPGRHATVQLGRPVPQRALPGPVRDLRHWVRRLHSMTGASAWLVDEGRATTAGRARIPVTAHRTSEPGDWVVAFPWRERDRAEAIAEAAYRLVELDLDPRSTRPADGKGGSRTLARAIRRIREASGEAPEWIRDEERRVPAVSISGTNGKSTTTRMITHILARAGRHPGTTTSDGVLIDEVLVEEGDLTGPMGAHRALRDPAIGVAVLETARGGIVLRGVGYESNEASVITNVSSDHLDLHGLHTLPELAEVKSVIARITRPDGVAVLNADDPLVAGVARHVRARVCLFSLRSTSPRVRRHVASGGQAIVLDEGWVTEVRGGTRRRIATATEIPATIGGMARHNIANALAAAGAALALGVSIEGIADGLRDFRPTAEQAPGRLNMYLVGKRLVIVDFAHNEAGVSVVLDMVESIVGPKGRRRAPVTMIVGTAGDRPDDTLRGIARIAAKRADEVAIKETLRYLRGRTRESMIGEFMAGVSAGGGDPAHVPVDHDEPAALRSALTQPGRAAAGDGAAVVVLMCHEDRSGVEMLLAELGAVAVDSPDGFGAGFEGT